MTVALPVSANAMKNGSLMGGHFRQRDVSNALMEGDCLQLLEQFPAHCVDLILCDLPYGTTQNPWDSPINLADCWATYKHVLKPS